MVKCQDRTIVTQTGTFNLGSPLIEFNEAFNMFKNEVKS